MPLAAGEQVRRQDRVRASRPDGFSEKNRLGIGTFTPSDPKTQDIAELVGGIDLSTIGEVGAESDPRAYRFDGELNIANRGMMEFVEMLKSDEKFLYVLLTLSQEQNIKTGRFSMIYADEVVVSHTNENEYASFVGNRKSEALQDRIILVKVPYNLRVSDEVKIYEKLLRQSALKDVHIAPHTLRVSSIFAVLTRLEESQKAGMGLMKKLKLYDGEDLDDMKAKDVKELQEETVREGMDGISPRYVINRLSSALVRDKVTLHQRRLTRCARCVTGWISTPASPATSASSYLNFIAEARKEYDEMARNEVQRAFVYSFEESAKGLLNNYLDNVEAYCNKTKVKDPITEEDLDPDEQLMRSIEEQIGITENAKKTFREEILIRISSLARRGQTFDYTSHERLKEAIEKKLFADLRDVVKITTSAKTPDPEQLKRSNEVISRLISDHGYCTHLRQRAAALRRVAAQPVTLPGASVGTKLLQARPTGRPIPVGRGGACQISSTVSQHDWSLHRKGQIDQERHKQKIKEAIKKNLANIVSEESIILSDGKRVFKVPIRSLEEYRFRYDFNKQQHAGQGDGESQVGDVIGARPRPGRGQARRGGRGAGRRTTTRRRSRSTNWPR